jgi:hypothetical protein
VGRGETGAASFALVEIRTQLDQLEAARRDLWIAVIGTQARADQIEAARRERRDHGRVAWRDGWIYLN